jgi:hypothetical protein
MLDDLKNANLIPDYYEAKEDNFSNLPAMSIKNMLNAQSDSGDDKYQDSIITKKDIFVEPIGDTMDSTEYVFSHKKRTNTITKNHRLNVVSKFSYDIHYTPSNGQVPSPITKLIKISLLVLLQVWLIHCWLNI